MKTQEKAQHTPMPWKHTTQPSGYNEKTRIDCIIGNGGECVASCNSGSAPNEANAAFIVCAVNSHEALLEQLKGTAIALHHNVEHEGSGEYFQNCTHPMCIKNQNAIAQAEAK